MNLQEDLQSDKKTSWWIVFKKSISSLVHPSSEGDKGSCFSCADFQDISKSIPSQIWRNTLMPLIMVSCFFNVTTLKICIFSRKKVLPTIRSHLLFPACENIMMFFVWLKEVWLPTFHFLPAPNWTKNVNSCYGFCWSIIFLSQTKTGPSKKRPGRFQQRPSPTAPYGWGEGRLQTEGTHLAPR